MKNISTTSQDTLDTDKELSWYSKEKSDKNKKPHGWLYKIGMGLLFVFLIYLLWPIVENWPKIWSNLQQANGSLVLLAIAIFSLTFAFTGLAMTVIATKAMPFRQTSLIQLAMAFTYKVFPAGLGGPGLMYRYATVAGYSTEAGLGYVGTVELIYFSAWLLYFIPVVILSGGLKPLGISHDFTMGWKMFFIGAIVAIVAYVILKAFGLVSKLKEKLNEVANSFVSIIKSPGKSSVSLGLMILSYSCTNAAFYISLRAVGVDIGFWQTVFVYLIFNSIGSCGPAPGGIGTVEAALIGGLMLVGVDAAAATTGVMIFRGVSFWLPTLPGYLAFRYGINHKFI